MRMFKTLTGLLAIMSIAFQLQAAPVEKPFAEKKVVLQISDADPGKQTLVLNVAGNIAKAFGPDNVDIEIVAFGPGVRLMFDDNHNKGRINSLTDSSGVRFAACGNTLKKMTQILGEKPAINANVTEVPGGAVRIMELVSDGYILLKP